MLIAITGGIGSGKTAVAEVFRTAGATVISADEINAELLKNSEYIQKLEKIFPFAVKNGVVDRKTLGEFVFKNEKERKKLNQLAHPEIIKEMMRRAAEAKGLVVAEIPLLAEVASFAKFDRIIVVIAPKDARIKRVSSRDNVAESYAKRVAECQVDEKTLLKFATDILINDGTLEQLQQKSLQLYHKIQG